MILYFSATGNTEYVASRIADIQEDERLDLTERIKKKDYSLICSKKPFVICSPIYVCEMPVFLFDYLKKLELSGSRDIYFVYTDAGRMGIAGMQGAKLAREKHMRYMGTAEIAMPNNYVASNFFVIPDEKAIASCLRKAEKKTLRVAGRIRDGRRLASGRTSVFEWVGTLAFASVWCRFMQPSRAFYAEDTCIGCGKCEKACPLNNIRLVDKKPVWSGRQCAHCMACIGNCPVEAIEYGKITQKKVKYHVKKYIM